MHPSLRRRDSRRRVFRTRATGAAGESVAVVAGEVDLSTAPEVEQALVEAVKSGRRLVVDLSGCTFLSSTGLRALLQAERARAEDADRIGVVVPDLHLRKVLQIAGVEALFDVVDRHDEPGLDAGSRAVS